LFSLDLLAAAVKETCEDRGKVFGDFLAPKFRLMCDVLMMLGLNGVVLLIFDTLWRFGD